MQKTKKLNFTKISKFQSLRVDKRQLIKTLKLWIFFFYTKIPLVLWIYDFLSLFKHYLAQLKGGNNLKHYLSFSFSWVKRKCNRVAHKAARLSVASLECFSFNNHNLPDALVSVCKADCSLFWFSFNTRDNLAALLSLDSRSGSIKPLCRGQKNSSYI